MKGPPSTNITVGRERRSLTVMNMPAHLIKEIIGCINQIGNLQLLSASENLEKSVLLFDAWMRVTAHTATAISR